MIDVESALAAEGLDWLRECPLEFIERGLRTPIRWPDGRLDEAAASMIEARRRGKHIGAIGGHRTRKDYTLALIDVWELLAYAPLTLLLVGPSEGRARDVQLHYIREILQRANLPRGTYVEQAERIYFPGVGSEIKIVTAQLAETNQASKARVTGAHRGRIRVHITEASSVPNLMWEQLWTLASGPDTLFAFTANAIYSPGHWEVHIMESAPACWELFRWSSLDSPYCSAAWVNACVEQEGWTPDSVLYWARVLGQYPRDASNVLIPMGSLVDAQVARFERPPHPTAMGVDCSGPGSDLTVLQKLFGDVVDRPIILPKRQGRNDQVDTQDAIRRVCDYEALHPSKVKIDSIGYGQGVADNLGREGYYITPVNFSARAIRNSLYLNVRAEAYWNLAQKIRRSELQLPADPLLVRDLADIKYDDDGRVIKIEDKAQIRKRLGYSPDRADALAYACYGPEPHTEKPQKMQMTRVTSMSGRKPMKQIMAQMEARHLPRWMFER